MGSSACLIPALLLVWFRMSANWLSLKLVSWYATELLWCSPTCRRDGFAGRGGDAVAIERGRGFLRLGVGIEHVALADGMLDDDGATVGGGVVDDVGDLCTLRVVQHPGRLWPR